MSCCGSRPMVSLQLHNLISNSMTDQKPTRYLKTLLLGIYSQKWHCVNTKNIFIHHVAGVFLQIQTLFHHDPYRTL